MRGAVGPALLLAVALGFQCLGQGSARRAYVQGRQLIVDGEPFIVRGICYSPTPVNQSVYFAPYGDYFTAEYSFIWLRDLPLIKAMGANMLRTYGWQPANDHSAFLDAADANGLYVMATYFTGEAVETPVLTAADRAKAVAGFQREVKRYASHPSLLFWSFGNELNGVWNGFLTEIGKDPEQPQCHWDERYDDLGGCWIHTRPAPFPPSDPCYAASYCVYARLFGWINDAAAAAKEVADVLVVSAFADVDNLYEKVGRAGDLAPDLDAWTAQVYRGATFGNFFEAMANNTDKPVLLTEYGVDAYHDECGTGAHTPCYNTFEDTLAAKPKPDVNGTYTGSFEDQDAQAEFAMNLTAEIVAASSHGRECASADHTTPHGACSCLGGFLMSWTDEFWKGAKSQAACTPTFDSEAFSPKKCMNKAHVTCGDWDAAEHDLCGYWLGAAPDHYVNEEWFGITSPTSCVSAVDSLRPRETYWRMRKLWTGKGKEPTLFAKCDELLQGRCAALGDGGASLGSWGDWLLRTADAASGANASAPIVCSGRGTCTTDWQKCGAGSSSEIATPCCSCVSGFAGRGCDELDVRVYIALGAGGLLGLLVLSMLANAIGGSIYRRVRQAELHEQLLS